MARMEIPFLGITSHANHQDGECSNQVNLRNKNNHLVPVPPRKVKHELDKEYDIVFIHKGNGYENWIGVLNSSIYSNINDVSRLIGSVDEKVNRVEQIGNTLSFITSSSVYYSLFKDKEYVFLGIIPELPLVQFETGEMDVRSKKFTKEYETTPSTSVDAKDDLVEATKGLAQVIIDESNMKYYDSFFIRYAFRLYDGSVIKHSSPIMVMGRKDFTEWALAYLPRDSGSSNYGPNSEVRVSMYKLNAKFDFSTLSEWSDIITSVDFFVTNYIGLSSPENVHPQFMSSMISDGRGTPKTYLHKLYYPRFATSLKEEAKEKAVETSQFYFYYSETDFSGQKDVEFPNSNVSETDNFYNVVHQEEMPGDSFSHHSVGSENSSVYNNRLRLSHITTKLYGGFGVKHFNWGSKYNGVLPSEGVSSDADFIVCVYIKTLQGVFITKINDNAFDMFMNAFISYPDSRASKIVVFSTSIDGLVFTERLSVKLTPHPRLNLAYAINDELKPYTSNSNRVTSLPDGHSYRSTSEHKITEINKLKVSEVNNPFVFPNVNTYTVGSGEILNESSIIMNVSDRNYGLYPVFVFTTDGIFTMAGQTQDSVHDSIRAPTYLEPPLSDVICATPYGVAFVTKRGLMLISQYKTKFLSPQLKDEDDEINLYHNDWSPILYDDTLPDNVLDKNSSFPSMPFREFLKNVQSMIYNPYEDEIVISSHATSEYCYVYNFASQSFYLYSDVFNRVVLNSFPDVYVIDNKEVKDYSKDGSDSASTSFMTRPISFKIDDIKTLERVYLRALLRQSKGVKFSLFHSMDGVNFTPSKGLKFDSLGNYIDIDLGLLARETYKYYLLLFSGSLNKTSQIKNGDFEVVKRFNNTKMR